MGISDFFKKYIISTRSQLEVTAEQETLENTLALNCFVLQSGINLIAAALANCEFETIFNNKKVKQRDYYRWNIQPNQNQNKVEFLNKLVSELIWKNEVLIVEIKDNLYIADSFSKTKSAFYDDTFSSVVINDLILDRTFRASEVMYLTNSDKDIRVLLNSLLHGYQRLISMSMTKYKRAGGRKGVLTSGTQAQKNTDWNKLLRTWYNEKFKDYFDKENAVIVLPEGQTYTETPGEGSKKSTSDVTDILNLSDRVYSSVGHALKIAPSLLKGEIAGQEEAMSRMMTFAVSPLAKNLEAEAIRKQYGINEYCKGNYLHINTSNIKAHDIFDIAVAVDKYIADGVFNVDEILEKLGEVPRKTEQSTKYCRTKNYEEGG